VNDRSVNDAEGQLSIDEDNDDESFIVYSHRIQHCEVSRIPYGQR